MTTDPGEPVILAIPADASGELTALLIDCYALPVIVRVEVTAPKHCGRAPLEGARPRLVHLRLGPGCLLSRMVWGKCPC